MYPNTNDVLNYLRDNDAYLRRTNQWNDRDANFQKNPFASYEYNGQGQSRMTDNVQFAPGTDPTSMNYNLFQISKGLANYGANKRLDGVYKGQELDSGWKNYAFKGKPFTDKQAFQLQQGGITPQNFASNYGAQVMKQGNVAFDALNSAAANGQVTQAIANGTNIVNGAAGTTGAATGVAGATGATTGAVAGTTGAVGTGAAAAGTEAAAAGAAGGASAMSAALPWVGGALALYGLGKHFKWWK